MPVDVTHPKLHVVERFLVRDITDDDDVVCVLVVVSHDCPEALLLRLSTSLTTVIVFTMSEVSSRHCC